MDYEGLGEMRKKKSKSPMNWFGKNLHQVNTSPRRDEKKASLRGSKGMVWWWGEKVYFGFSTRASFGKIPCWDDIFSKRGSKQLGPSNASHSDRQQETQVLIHLGKEGKAYGKIKQREILSWNGQWKKESALGSPTGGNGQATNGLVGEAMSITN